jgi:hypothetical protein
MEKMVKGLPIPKWVGPKMGADSSARNTPNAPKIYLPNLSAKAQKFWISMKKGFIGRP